MQVQENSVSFEFLVEESYQKTCCSLEEYDLQGVTGIIVLLQSIFFRNPHEVYSLYSTKLFSRFL